MRVTVAAIGTRGDVQPMLALAAGLHRAGHDVRMATEQAYAEFVRSHGMQFHCFSGNSEKLHSGKAGILFRESVERTIGTYRRFWLSYLAPSTRRHMRELVEPCKGADLIIAQPWIGIAPSLADRFGVPCVSTSVVPVPVLPTREFPYPISRAARAGLGSEANWRSWAVGVRNMNVAHSTVQWWRTQVLGVPRQSFRESLEALYHTPTLLGFSEMLVPRPKEWPATAEVTGYWFLDTAANYEPPVDLVRFLDSGDPPVVAGFGSHVGTDVKGLTELVIAALRAAGCRGILISGWGGLRRSDLPENMYGAEKIPYDWLLPRAAGIVHHGGSGTTAIATRAGLPQLVVPFGFDQTFWGWRVASLGVAPEPIPSYELRVESLAAAIRRLVSDAEMRARAKKAGERLRAEDGVGNAVRAVDRIAGRRTAPCSAC
jgi:sterol 3beta-glucosyltransferase